MVCSVAAARLFARRCTSQSTAMALGFARSSLNQIGLDGAKPTSCLCHLCDEMTHICRTLPYSLL